MNASRGCGGMYIEVNYADTFRAPKSENILDPLNEVACTSSTCPELVNLSTVVEQLSLTN